MNQKMTPKFLDSKKEHRYHTSNQANHHIKSQPSFTQLSDSFHPQDKQPKSFTNIYIQTDLQVEKV